MPVRAAAARCLLALVEDQGSLTRVLAHFRPQVAGDDRALLAEICYGTSRHYWQLNGVLQQLVNKPFRSKDRDIEMLILCGLYQLLYMQTPAHAAVNETVHATATLKKPWARKLVNALLRRFQRESEALLASLDAAQQASLPDWLYDELAQAWPEQIDTIAAASTARPPLCLRVNTAVSTRADYTGKLDNAGIGYQLCEHSPTGIRLDTGRSVETMPGFADGLVSVQDESAQLAATLLPLQAGQRVLDMCAAPGGKTCHLLERQADLQVVAADIAGDRLQRVQENLLRLRQRAALLQCDGAQPPLRDQSFDHILLDAPCSGSGVLRRNPDIRIQRRASDIPQLAALQLRLLHGAWPLLKPGGYLLYATCSILPEENDRVVERFLAQTPDAQSQAIDTDAGLPTPYGRQLMITPSAHDGFYYALFQKAARRHTIAASADAVAQPE